MYTTVLSQQMNVGWEINVGSFIFSLVPSSNMALKILHCISQNCSLFPFMLLVTYCRAFPKKQRKKVRSYARSPHTSQEKPLLCGQGVKKRAERERRTFPVYKAMWWTLQYTENNYVIESKEQLFILAANVKRSNKSLSQITTTRNCNH